MANSPKLIIAGSIAIDRIMNYPGTFTDVIKPEKIHALSLSLLLNKLEDTRGGTGANIAYSSALLGLKPVLLGSIGKDAGEYIRDLAKIGVDVAYIHTSKLPTASFSVFTDSEDNQIGGFYPGAMADAGKASLQLWNQQDTFVVVAAHDPVVMRAQVADAKKHGLRLMYDVGQQVANSPKADLQAGLDAAEVVIVNDYECGLMAERLEISEEKLFASTKVFVVTRGRQGSVILEGGKVKAEVACARPIQDVDPTGAGDAYRAGFLYGYLQGMGLDVCGQLGATVASFAVEHHGTQKHRFTMDEIRKRLKTTFNTEI